MKFSKIALLCGVAAIFGAWQSADAAQNLTTPRGEINMHKQMRRMAPNTEAFNASRMEAISRVNADMNTRFGKGYFHEEEAITPAHVLGPSRTIYDLSGPDGSVWYCTTELSYNVIEHQWYDEYVLSEYKYEIYDSEFNLVGTIHDKMRYQDDEVRVPGPDQGIELLPKVTKNYFNTDDLYEIVVSLAVNTTTPGLNHYRSVIYSLNGEKETVKIERDGTEVEVEVDKPVGHINSFVADVLDASSNGVENVFMTFSGDYGEFIDIDPDKLFGGTDEEKAEEGKKYWDMLNNQGVAYTTYSKANEKGELKKVFEKHVTYMTMQGDQESTPVMLTFMRDGKAYIVAPYYKESFFYPYYSPLEDMKMRENNSLMIDLYELQNEASTLVSSTEIPFGKVDKEGVLATYYGVGSLRYSRDVEFDAAGKPQYVITRCNYVISMDETTDFCYYRYDSEGNMITTIFEGAQSSMSMCDIEGHNDQAVFVIYDDNAGYVYNFVDIEKGYGDSTVKIGYLIDAGADEPEILSFNVDRAAIGDSYKFAFEMRAPLVDEYDNNFMRIAWFNADGSFDRIDHVDMGKNVMYATTNINGLLLEPKKLCSDDAHEYMVLIKRGISDTTSASQEELLIAQPVDENLEGGKNILYLTPQDKGKIANIIYLPEEGNSKEQLFLMYYRDEDVYAEFYDLPFDTASIKDIENVSTANGFDYDGKVIASASGALTIYNAQGIRVATSTVGKIDLTSLPTGIYVAVSGDAKAKFMIK